MYLFITGVTRWIKGLTVMNKTICNKKEDFHKKVKPRNPTNINT